MPSYVWISLAFFLLTLLGGGTWSGINARRAWTRGLPAFRRVTAASASLDGRTAELERRVTALGPKIEQMQHDTARLSGAVGRARVLFGAVHELRTVYRVVRLFGP